MDKKTMKIRNAFKKAMIAMTNDVDSFWETADSALLSDRNDKFEQFKSLVEEEKLKLSEYLGNILNIIDEE